MCSVPSVTKSSLWHRGIPQTEKPPSPPPESCGFRRRRFHRIRRFASPSGHAAAATAVAGAVSLAHPLAVPALVPLAAAIAYSRVALRVHHLGDVIAGVALGAAGVAAASALL